MDESLFTAQKSGQLVKVSAPWDDISFIPNPLHDSWDTPSDLVELCAQAREELARLDGAGRYMKDVSLGSYRTN